MSDTTKAIPISLWDTLSRWSQETFGSDAERGPIYPLRHLLKEVEAEAIPAAEIWEFAYLAPLNYENDLREEICDCFLLVLDAARRAGMSEQQLREGSFLKLAKNMTREWSEPDEEGVIEHKR